MLRNLAEPLDLRSPGVGNLDAEWRAGRNASNRGDRAISPAGMPEVEAHHARLGMADRRRRDRGPPPPAYARYRRPIVEGLRFFLGRLPGPEIAEILSDQAALPADASAEERLVALAERCPALHKLGQILARDRRLAPELRRHLQRLESLPPATPVGVIEKTLADELGPLEKLGVALEPPALAEASVAVVIPFRIQGASQDGHPDRGVFKVLKPGIEDRLARELGPAPGRRRLPR